MQKSYIGPRNSRGVRGDSSRKSVRGSRNKGSMDDYGKYFRCWNCNTICNIERDGRGDRGVYDYASVDPVWLRYTDDAYWAVTSSKGSFVGTRWKAAHYNDGAAKTGIHIEVSGSWYTSFRPTEVIINHNIGQDVSSITTAQLSDAGTSALHSDSLNDGVPVSLTFSSDDISTLVFEQTGTLRQFYITDIQFLAPATLSKGCPFCGTLNWHADV